MSIYSVVTIFTLFLTLGLTVLVGFSNLRKKTNIIFTFFSLSVSGWILSNFMADIATSLESALFWSKLAIIWPALLLLLFYLFVVELYYKNLLKNKKTLFYYFFTSFLIIVLSPTSLNIQKVEIFDWGTSYSPGILYYVLFLYFAIGFLLPIKLLLRIYKDGHGPLREKVKYILIGSSITVFFGVLTTIVLPILGYSEASILGPPSTVFFIGFIALSITKYQFLDIKFVLRKSSVYLFSLSVILLVAIILKYFFVFAIPNIYIIDNLVILLVSLFSFPYIRDYFYKISNKYFFASLYDTQEVITTLSNELGATLDIRRLYSIILNRIEKTLHVKYLTIFLKNSNNKFIVEYEKGGDFDVSKDFGLDENLVEMYLKQGKIIVRNDLQDSFEKEYEILKKNFLNKEAEIIIPLIIRSELIGMIVLSKKESKDSYNREDVSLLDIIATQSAIALDNSIKYEEAKNFNVRLEREVEQAVTQLREANEKLVKLDTAKSDFISIASHQLRTPLTVIKGYVSMILEGNFGEIEEKARIPIEKVYESNERLIKLVEHLLNISRIESGRIQYKLEPYDLKNLLDGIINGQKHEAKRKGLDLSFNLPDVEIPLVNIDPPKIRQVIINLIDNAIKYTYKSKKKRGFVLVRLKYLPEKMILRLIVEDNGLGISKEDMPNLFKKFSRGKEISIVHTEGTGLGLYVSKQIIEAHDGNIYAESEGTNRGSKIYFDIPIIKNK